MQFQSLLNKKIVVRQKDGFKKFGILKEETDDFISMVFIDGRLHFIPKNKIDIIEEDGQN